MSSPALELSQKKPPRLDCIDALRGLVMIFMCLDHTREFYFDLRINPEDLEKTSPLLFATRWITHFCAPTFIFLAGVGAYLYEQKTNSRARVMQFLFTRGLWLIFLEFTVVHFGWLQTFSEFAFMFIVIAAIGASMIALGCLIVLPYPAICGIGISIVAFHNCLDTIAPARGTPDSNLFWIFLHTGGYVEELRLAVGYPILSWTGVICCGYGFGRIMLLAPPRRRQICLSTGLGCTLLFFAMRWLNAYGDPSTRQLDIDFPESLMSFLKCTKYPPSLLYLLMTLGPVLIVLAAFDRATDASDNDAPGWMQPLLVFGRVPLFFYLVHLYLISLSSRLLYWITKGEPISSLAVASRYGADFERYPDIFGFPLWITYPAWILMLVTLLPLCHWYGQLKRRSQNPLLRYL